MADIKGHCDPRFEKMADLLSASIDAGTDVGASVAVTVGGEFVVDIWGGWVDEAKSAPWEHDTITNVWSSTKTMLGLAALVCHDRGLIDVYEPVAMYWPEFAQNGKEHVTVAQLMSHTSGVSGWAPPFRSADLYDWDLATSKLAEQPTWWEPGTQSGYHAINQGFLVGEVIRRASGMSFKEFFRTEIAEPLGADFQIGVAPDEAHRVSDIIPPEVTGNSRRFIERIGDDSVFAKTFRLDDFGPAEALTPEWRAADLGAVNGHGNARGAGRVQSVVANGGEVDGVRLLSQDTIDLIFDEQSNGPDLVLILPVRMGIGYGLVNPALEPHYPDGRICRWGGWGGSSVVVDVDRNVTITYMMNKMHSGLVGDVRSFNLVRAAYDALI